MKRRSILIASGLLAVSPTRVFGQTGGDAEGSCDETVEITEIRSGDEVVRTREVPKVWYEQSVRAKSVLSEIQQKYSSESWYAGHAISRGESEICDGYQELVITVYASDTEAANRAIGDEWNGVTVQISRERDAVPLALADGSGDGPTRNGLKTGLSILGGLALFGGIDYLFSDHDDDD